MPLLKSVSHLLHLIGFAHRWAPHYTEGPGSCSEKVGILEANGTTILVPLAGPPRAWWLWTTARTVCHVVSLPVVNKIISIRLASLLPMGPPVFLPPDGSPRAWWL